MISSDARDRWFAGFRLDDEIAGILLGGKQSELEARPPREAVYVGVVLQDRFDALEHRVGFRQ